MQPSGSDIMAAYDRHQRAVDVQDQAAVLSRAEAVAEEFRAPGPVALVLVRALSKISVRYAKISENIRQISLNFSQNFVPCVWPPAPEAFIPFPQT